VFQRLAQERVHSAWRCKPDPPGIKAMRGEGLATSCGDPQHADRNAEITREHGPLALQQAHELASDVAETDQKKVKPK
jgi:hypothetical protein